MASSDPRFTRPRSPFCTDACHTDTLTPGVCARIQIAVEKPLGVKLGARPGTEGGVLVKGVTGNAAKAGLKNGDQIIYHSSFFGDELWPADSVGFCNTAINACPNVVRTKGSVC
jgi:hypothetical protein